MDDTIVVDASVVLSWCFEDQATPSTDAVLALLEHSRAVVPSIWPLEVGNVLLVAERKQRLTLADSKRFLALVADLPITVVPDTTDSMLGEILELARQQHLSTYDASYLSLALRNGLPLATQDRALLEAAQRLGVELVGTSGTQR